MCTLGDRDGRRFDGPGRACLFSFRFRLFGGFFLILLVQAAVGEDAAPVRFYRFDVGRAAGFHSFCRGF